VVEAPGEKLPLADSACDSVLFLQSLQYISDPAAALREALRVLAPGGRLLVLTLVSHDFVEAERYGHRHRGFLVEDLQRWCAGLADTNAYTLPPEDQPPRFQTLVFTGRKP
jgi:ArsR family transcriptional regulator